MRRVNGKNFSFCDLIGGWLNAFFISWLVGEDLGCDGGMMMMIGERIVARLDVTFHVQSKVIAAREASITVTALEGLGAGVLSVVARQLVAAGKAPFASFP
jgi:hypothetical protein